jgi:hypothetical protein
MRRWRSFVALGVAGAVLLSAGVAAPASAGGGRPKTRPPTVLLTGLSSPKGVAVNGSGDPVVAQGAFGAPGPVLVHVLRGPDRGQTFEVTDPVNLVDVAVSPRDGTGWGIGGDGVLYHQLRDGSIVPVLDIPAYQQGDPDPVDQDGIPEESNPYGLAVTRRGDALVADAAGNDLIKVTPDGRATTLARFDLETVRTDHLPPDFPLPPGTTKLTAESVPTSITIGRDGAIYVGELKGFPFRPGSSRIWRIDPRARPGVLCSVNTPRRGCTTAWKGLTAIQDIALGSHGRLYVYELARDGTLAFEEGLETGVFPPAVLLEIKGRRRTELLAGQLSQPGGVAVGRGGTVFVTDAVFTPDGGRLLSLRR